ncbi:hypothetical protein [Actinoplanes philippinensis]|uniref:hypothetical protein n=1 Tax=Actinoplanes philippinensis TaxID=35752 RepID=UPI0033E45EF0
MRPVSIIVGILAVLSVAACGPVDPAPAAVPPVTSAPAVATAAAPATAASPSADAVKACKLAAEAPRPQEAIEIDEAAIKAIIDSAAKSGSGPVEEAGSRVRAGYTVWQRTAIGDDAAKATDALLAAVARLDSACAEAAITRR